MQSLTQNKYTPVTSHEAAKILGVTNIDTFQRKFLEKTGQRISELPEGKIPFEQFLIIAKHFAKNYPQAADVVTRFSSDASASSGRQADDKQTISGRQADGKPMISGRADASGGRQADEITQADGRTDTIADERTQADEIGRLLKVIENQEITLKNAQKKIIELEQNNIRADGASGRQADEIGRLNKRLDDERTEIVRLKQSLADERTKFRADLQLQADDFNRRLKEELDVRAENVRLKVTDETRKAVTASVRKEISHEYQVRFEKQQNEHFAAIQVLNEELQENKIELHKLRADVALFNKKYSFQFKKILESELSVINVVSNILAFYGLTLVFELMGALAAVLMIFFFKNVMKNVKIAKRESAARFGMLIAYLIESVYGFFHYTTFYNLLKDKEATLLIQSAPVVAFCMTVIISGLSISALIQSRNQAKDDNS